MEYEEQIEWTKIRDLYIYVQNIPDLDDNLLKIIINLVEGFTEMINKENKTTVLIQIKSLLEQIKDRHLHYESSL